MTLVMLARHIDISIGSQFSLCAVTAGLLAQAGLPMPLVALGTLLAGAAFGAVNGGLVAGLGLPSIVVTLATLVIYRDGLRWWRQGEFVKDLPADFQWLGAGPGGGAVGDRRRRAGACSPPSPWGCATWRRGGRSTPPAPTPRRPAWPASGRARVVFGVFVLDGRPGRAGAPCSTPSACRRSIPNRERDWSCR